LNYIKIKLYQNLRLEEAQDQIQV